MSLKNKYRKQVVLTILASMSAASWPPINLHASTTVSGALTNLGLSDDIEDSILEANPNYTGDEIATGTLEHILNTDNIYKAINYLQAMNVSILDGIEYNNLAEAIKNPKPNNSTTTQSKTEQKFVDISLANNAYNKLKTFMTTGTSDKVGWFEQIKKINDDLTEAITNVESMSVENGTGDEYYQAIVELIQYIDTIDAHTDLTPDIPSIQEINRSTGDIAEPKQLDPKTELKDTSGVLDTDNANAVKTTTRIHTSTLSGADVPEDEYWVTETVLQNLLSAIKNSTDIAQNVHAKGLFAEEALKYTPVIGALLEDTGNGTEEIENPAYSNADYDSSDQDVRTPDEQAYGQPTGTDSDYSSVKDLTDTLSKLKTAYEEYIDAVQNGTAEVAKEILNSSAKIKMAMANAGMPVVYTSEDSDKTPNDTKIITDLIADLYELITGMSNGYIETPNYNNNVTGTRKLLSEPKVYLYVRKATKADIDEDNLDKTYLYKHKSGTIEAGDLIVCSQSEATDIALYIDPLASDTVDKCYPLNRNGYIEGTHYFFTPAVKEKSEYVSKWTPGGSYSGLSEIDGTYITMENATELIQDIANLIDIYQQYDGLTNDGQPYNDRTDIMSEINAGYSNNGFTNVFDEKFISILNKLAEMTGQGSAELKTSEYEKLQKLLIHLGLATGTNNEFDLKNNASDCVIKENGTPYEGQTNGDGVLQSSSTTSFKIEDHESTTLDNITVRVPYNISNVSGINLATNAKWVTMDVNKALYNAAKKAWDLVVDIENEDKYDEISIAKITAQVNALQSAINSYDLAAQPGNMSKLAELAHGLAVAVGENNGGTQTGGLGYLSLTEYDDTDKTIEQVRKLVGDDIAISDEGIFEIIEDKDSTEKTIVEEKQLMSVANPDPTKYVTPEEVSALEKPLVVANKLHGIIKKVVKDYISSVDSVQANDFSNDTTVDDAKLIKLGQILVDDIANELNENYKHNPEYSIELITDNLEEAIEIFENAATKEALDPDKYTENSDDGDPQDSRTDLRVALWGDDPDSHTSTSPADGSARDMVRIQNGILYLGEDEIDPEHKEVVLSKDGGFTYEEYDPVNYRWINKGLIPADCEWVSEDDLKTYNTAIVTAENILTISSPTVIETNSSEAKKLTEDKLVEGETDKYKSVSFDSTFLSAFKTNPDYFQDAIESLEEATEEFKSNYKEIDVSIGNAQAALQRFKNILGKPDSGADTPDPELNGYVTGNTTAQTGVKKIVYAIKSDDNITGYFPIGVHQSEDGIINITGNALLQTNVEAKDGEASNLITQYVTKAEVKNLSDAFLAVDKLIANPNKYLLEELQDNQNYLTESIEYKNLQKAITDFNNSKKDILAGDYKEEISTITSYIEESDTTSTESINGAIKANPIHEGEIATFIGDTKYPITITGSVGDNYSAEFNTDHYKYSKDGIHETDQDGIDKPKDGNVKTPLNPNEYWVNPEIAGDLIEAINKIKGIVLSANSTSITKENEHIKGYLNDDEYFTKELDKVKEEINKFVITKYEAPELTDDLITEAEELRSSLLISNVSSGIDALTLEYLQNEDDHNNGFDSAEIVALNPIKYVDKTYADKLYEVIQKAKTALADTSNDDDLDKAQKLKAVMNEYQTEAQSLTLDSDSEEIALYNAYITLKNKMEKSDPLKSDSKNGSMTAPSEYWLEPAKYDQLMKLYKDIALLLDTTIIPEDDNDELQQIIYFKREINDLIQKSEVVSKFVPQEGKMSAADEGLRTTALNNLKAKIDDLAYLIGLHKYKVENGELIEDESIQKNSDPILISYLNGADIQGTDSTPSDNNHIPDGGKRWVTSTLFNTAKSNLVAGVNLYNNSETETSKLTEQHEKITILLAELGKAKYGAKEQYELFIKTIRQYILDMELGSDGYPSASAGTLGSAQMPIPKLGEIVEATSGASVSPLKYWAKPEHVEAMSRYLAEAKTLLHEKANLEDRIITISLEDLISEHDKLKTAFETFYGRKIDGTIIADKVAQIQKGSEGILTAEITSLVNQANAHINSFLFLPGVEISIKYGPTKNSAGTSIEQKEYLGIPSTGSEEDNTAITKVSAKNGLDVEATHKYYNLSDLLTYIRVIAQAQAAIDLTTPDEDKLFEMTEKLKAAKVTFEKTVKTAETSGGGGSETNTAFTQAQIKLANALKTAYSLIGMKYDSNSFKAEVDNTINGADFSAVDAVLTNTDYTEVTLIRNSPSKSGIEVAGSEHWVATRTYERYEATLEHLAKVHETSDSAESMGEAVRVMQEYVNSLLSNAQLCGTGNATVFEEKIEALKVVLNKSILLRDGVANSKYEPTDSALNHDYEDYWSTDYKGMPLSISFTGDDVIGYYTSSMLYNVFSSLINVSMKSIDNAELKNGTVGLADIEKLTSELTASLADITVGPNTKPKIGKLETGDTLAAAVKARARLKTAIDKANTFVATVKASSNGENVEDHVPWITNVAIPYIDKVSNSGSASENFASTAPLDKLKELLPDANATYRKPIKTTSEASHYTSQLIVAVAEFTAIIERDSSYTYKYIDESGNEQTATKNLDYSTHVHGNKNGTKTTLDKIKVAKDILEKRVTEIETFMANVHKVSDTVDNNGNTGASGSVTDSDAAQAGVKIGGYYVATGNSELTTLESIIDSVETTINNATTAEQLTGGSKDGRTVPNNGLRNDKLSELNAAFEDVAGQLGDDGVLGDGQPGSDDVPTNENRPLKIMTTSPGFDESKVNLEGFAEMIIDLFKPTAEEKVIIPYNLVKTTSPNLSAGSDFNQDLIDENVAQNYLVNLLEEIIGNDNVKVEVTLGTTVSEPGIIGSTADSNIEVKNAKYSGADLKIKLTETKDSDNSAAINPEHSYLFEYNSTDSTNGNIHVNKETSLSVEIEAPIVNEWSDVEKVDVLSVATLVEDSIDKLELGESTSVSAAQGKLKEQLDKIIEDAHFVVNENGGTDTGIDIEILTSEGTVVVGEDFEFTVSLTIDSTKYTQLVPRPITVSETSYKADILSRLHEDFSTADKYKVTFLDQDGDGIDEKNAFTIRIGGASRASISMNMDDPIIEFTEEYNEEFIFEEEFDYDFQEDFQEEFIDEFVDLDPDRSSERGPIMFEEELIEEYENDGYEVEEIILEEEIIFEEELIEVRKNEKKRNFWQEIISKIKRS
ncbi:MAG: hypothetical protein ATN31_09810 [Candidatus Epulonipiscioides saccharophilum]|nr:MAG: hypothetical protein ATN31_09810 [Epulopiscium sp. AS2M-Bin001]